MPKSEDDVEELLDTCFLLNPLQLHRLLANLRDDFDQPVTPALLTLVSDRTVESKDENLLMQFQHADFSKPPLVVLSNLAPFIPQSLQNDDIITRLGEDSQAASAKS